jgi:hypothetical protein
MYKSSSVWKASELYWKLNSYIAVGFGFLNVILLIPYIRSKTTELEFNVQWGPSIRCRAKWSRWSPF